MYYLLISLPSSLKLHALTEPSCPLEKVNGPWVLWKKSSIHGGYVWSHTPLLTGKWEGRIKSERRKGWSKLLSLWIENETTCTFPWHRLLYNASLSMTLDKILQCSRLSQGGLRISSDGDDRMRAKIKTQKNLYGFQQTPKNPWNKN